MRVVVADDAVLLREGLVRILADAGYDVVAAVGSAPELTVAAAAHGPGLVIADVRMPPNHRDDGIIAARQIRQAQPDTAIVLLSQHIEAVAVVDLFQDNPAGLGYLLKDRVLEIDDFLESVSRVAGGGVALDPAVVAQLVRRPTTEGDPLSDLTTREQQVLALMAEGLSNGGIGARMYLGVRTIETYTSAIFAKLGIYSDVDEHRRVKAVLAYLRASRNQ